MVKGVSVGRRETRSKELGGLNYDYAKTVITIAKKNGWDIETLDLIPKDLPAEAETNLSKKQATERNRLVKCILQRFSKILTPPIPSDLEQSIKSKDPSNWLPWEKEAIEKISQWRLAINKIRPEILKEFRRVLAR
jgi:hypothetical protein